MLNRATTFVPVVETNDRV